LPARLTRNGDAFELDLRPCRRGTNEFDDALTKIRQLPGRNYNPDTKIWSVPAEGDIGHQILHSIQPDADDDVVEWIRAARRRASAELTTPLPEDADLMIPWSRGRAAWQPEFIEIAGSKEPFNGLLKHQRPAVDLAAHVRKLLICDDMGGGKTGTALSAIAEYILRNPLPNGDERVGPKLIVCPNSVKGTWQNEIEMWLGTNEPYQIIDSTSVKGRHDQLVGAIADNAYCVVNWEQLRLKREERKLKDGGKKKVWTMKEPLFESTPWLAVVADEIHRAKNRKSLQSRGLRRVRADDGIMLGLSGTPLMNDPSELWAILAWLWPNDYHERGAAHSPGARAYWTFYEEYVDYTEGYFGKEIIGVKNPDALRFELSQRLVRRTKDQMQLGLEPKRRIPVPLELNKKQRKLYDKAEEELWLEVEQQIKGGDKDAKRFAEGAVKGEDAMKLYRLPNGAARTVRLRQIIETPACLGGPDDSAILDDVVERVMDSRPNQWVVFTEFKPTVNCLVERLRKKGLAAEAYHGDIDPEERRVLGKRFQAGELDVLVGTQKAMREGVTLTAAFNQYWCSRDWVPDNNEQGEDRQHRIGQQQQVLIWIAQPRNTVATGKVEPTNRRKEAIVRAVLPKDEIHE
jgi:SNF2 family DNA or RNA helicase